MRRSRNRFGHGRVPSYGSPRRITGGWDMKGSGGRATLACVAALLTSLVTAAGAAGATPLPAVQGPLPSTDESHPFGGAAWQLQPQDLAEHGYVEEEYILSGKANVY